MSSVLRKNHIASHAFSKGTEGEPTVEQLMEELGVERTAVVEGFQELERVGAGKFVVGRRGKHSRFQWKVGLDTDMTPTTRAQVRAGDDSPAMLEHTFHVRPGVVATFKLPDDISRSEAERLSQLLLAIPFE